MRASAQQIAGYAKAAGFPPNEIATATAVALAESGGETTATNKNTNGSTDYGLWQINTIHGQLLNQGDKFNPLDNAKMALTVFARAGNKWTPWTVYKSGAYRGQLATATLAAGNPIDPQPGELSGTISASVGEGGAEISASAGESPSGILGLVDTINRLTSGSLWLRIGAFILGACLIGFSLLRLSGTDQLVGKAAKMAVTKKLPV